MCLPVSCMNDFARRHVSSSLNMAKAGHTSEGICAKYIIHPKRILVVACTRLAIRIRPNGSGQIYSISTLLKVRIITAVVDV